MVNAYEHGTREPGADALSRLAGAAGFQMTLAPAATVDVHHNATVLSQVLDLAHSLPFRRSRTLRYPPFLSRVERK